MHTSDFKNKIKESFLLELPGINAHRIMSPLNRPIKPLEEEERKNYKKSAVSVLCFTSDSTVKFILVQRPEYEGDHSAQVSFPGGKWEKEDESIEYTARRETREEIGVELHKSHLLGQLSEVYIPVSNFIIEPFVYYLDTEPKIIPDKREVASVHLIPISELLDNNNIKTMDMQLISGIKMKRVPYFLLNDKIVWGATAIILSELKEILK